jgi:hypothetical protein
VSPDGYNIGTLCAIGTAPQKFDDQAIRLLVVGPNGNRLEYDNDLTGRQPVPCHDDCQATAKLQNGKHEENTPAG